jgi:polyhydroxyalkanoate synthesis repressor PhaR
MRTIKRYANRKLYDTETSRYVTLDHVLELIRSGEDVRVIDNRTGNDISRETMAQIILRLEKSGQEPDRSGALRDLITRGRDSVKDALKRSLDVSKGFVSQVEESVDAVVKRLTERGLVTPDEAKALVQSLVAQAGRHAERLEAMLDERINVALTRLNIPTAAEVEEMRRAVEELSRKVEELARIERGAGAGEGEES